MLEGESEESLNSQRKLFHKERALPDLASNIKCGNSLIGPEFYDDEQMELFDDEEKYRINVFDWKTEFPKIMKRGGFDAVIGNPPYVRSITMKESNPMQWDALRNAYETARSREWDIYMTFVEQGIQLLHSKGVLGFILPNKFMNSLVGENLRGLIANGNLLNRLVDFRAFQIFQGATTYTCLMFLARSGTKDSDVHTYRGDVARHHETCPLPEENPSLWVTSRVESAHLQKDTWEFGTSAFFRRQRPGWTTLGEIATIFSGTGTRADKVFLVRELASSNAGVTIHSSQTDCEHVVERTLLRPAVRGRSLSRYEMHEQDLRLIAPYRVDATSYTLLSEEELRFDVPMTHKYLVTCRERLNEREKGRFKDCGWYQYGRPQNMQRFSNDEKLIMPDVGERGSFFIDDQGYWLIDTAYAVQLKPSVTHDLASLAGILNSRLLTIFLMEFGTPLRGGYFRMKTSYLSPFPIPEFSIDEDCLLQIAELARRLQGLVVSRVSTRTSHERTAIVRQIDATDRRIDQLVYELYGLTDEEISIVEEATAK